MVQKYEKRERAGKGPWTPWKCQEPTQDLRNILAVPAREVLSLAIRCETGGTGRRYVQWRRKKG